MNLLKAIDISSDDCRLEFYPTDNDREEVSRLLSDFKKPVATISPVSRRIFNRWPLERYAELALRLSNEFGYQIVILAGPGEDDVAEKLGRLIESITPYIPKISRLGQLGAMFERAEIHIGNDNGPKHIAVACGAPTFTIYGPHSHISWTYPDSDRHRYVIPADVDPACQTAKHICEDACILKIPTAAVLERVIPMISKIRAEKSSIKAP